jgi:hypothetical protein
MLEALKGLKKESVAIIIVVVIAVLLAIFWFRSEAEKRRKESYVAAIDESYCAGTGATSNGNMPPGVVGLVFEPHAGPLAATVNFPDGDMGRRSFTVISDQEPFLTYVNKKPQMC